jgi:hypothetical protein
MATASEGFRARYTFPVERIETEDWDLEVGGDTFRLIESLAGELKQSADGVLPPNS